MTLEASLVCVMQAGLAPIVNYVSTEPHCLIYLLICSIFHHGYYPCIMYINIIQIKSETKNMEQGYALKK